MLIRFGKVGERLLCLRKLGRALDVNFFVQPLLPSNRISAVPESNRNQPSLSAAPSSLHESNDTDDEAAS